MVRAIGRVAPMAAAGGLLGLTSLALLWQETQGRFVAGVQVDPGSALLRLLMPTLFWAVFAVVGVVAVGSNLLTRLASAPSVVAALANFLPPAGASLVPRPPPPANALGSCGSPPQQKLS